VILNLFHRQLAYEFPGTLMDSNQISEIGAGAAIADLAQVRAQCANVWVGLCAVCGERVWFVYAWCVIYGCSCGLWMRLFVLPL
jgi:hypothetical protein